MSGNWRKKDGTPTRLRHGHAYAGKISKEYIAWCNMKARCLCVTNPDYYLYGGRGITIAKEWLIFDNFIADMGLRPPKYMLERRNNNKGYNMENCYWATASEQQRNRRKFGTCR